MAKLRIIILSYRTAVQLQNHVIGFQRGFKYTEQKPFGRRYLGVTRTTMSSAVHTLTQVKARYTIRQSMSTADAAVVQFRFIHRVHIFTRDGNRVSVSAYSAGAYTATLLVMVNVMKGSGRAPPPHQPGIILPS